MANGWFCGRVAVVGVLMLVAIGRPASSRAGDELQEWLATSAVPVRTIVPSDNDWSDLEPLIERIGAARVVQLGEPSHGAGSSFAAKARLIQFLHQRLGFDVIAWESGMYGLRLTDAGMRGGEDAVTAARRGVFGIWAQAAEVKPLFEYVRSSQGTLRPIDMAGFDIQITAQHSAERFASDLASFVDRVHDADVRRRASELAKQLTSSHERIYARIETQVKKKINLTPEEADNLRPTPQDSTDLQRAADELLDIINKRRATFEQAHGAAEVAFMERAIANLRADGINTFERERKDRPANKGALESEQWNRRDTLMASNLRWLIEHRYPNRKFIVWAHNAHAMHAHFAADWSGVHLAPQAGGMTPAGQHLKHWLGDDLYTIAITTYEGADGWAVGNKTTPIAPAAAGSLEARLHELGMEYLFLDLRGTRLDAKHPLRSPMSMRISGYGPPTGPYGNDKVPDLASAFDAVFYIDRMQPATRVP